MRQRLLAFGWLLPLFLVLLCYVSLSARMIQQESLTFDERVYLEEGINNLVKGRFEIDPYNPPLIRQLTALPLVVSGTKDATNLPSLQQVAVARWVVVLFGTVIISLCYWIVARLAGSVSAFMATTLLIFEPTFLAHSHYITPDIGSIMFYLLSWSMFLLVLKRPTLMRSVILGLFIGATAAAKIPIIFLLLMSMMLYGFFSLPGKVFYWYQKYRQVIAVSSAVAILVLWSSFHFNLVPVMIPSQNPKQLANRVMTWSDDKGLPFITSTIAYFLNRPLPLGDYINQLKRTQQRSSSLRQDYINGSYRNGTWDHLLQLYLLKTPIPFLILSLTACGWILINLRQPNIRHLAKRYLLPIGTIFSVSFLLNTPPLVRYLLVATPLLAIMIGLVLHKILPVSIGKLVALLLVFWMIYNTLQVMPHPLIFHNQFVYPSYTSLTDSNVDWGQGLITLAEYLRQSRFESIQLSYFGRDDADRYGFASSFPWGSYKNDEICRFHRLGNTQATQAAATIISISNWHNCGYAWQTSYDKNKIKTVVAGSFLIFPYEPTQ